MTAQSVLLRDICDINPVDKVNLSSDTLCSFVPMDAVDEIDALIAKRALRILSDVSKGYTQFAENDVLIAKITPCMENGKCAIAKRLQNGIGFGSTEFHVLRAKKNILPEWLYYFWRYTPTRKKAAVNMTGSAGQKRVPVNFLESLEIPLPSIVDQKMLVKQLNHVDRLRYLRRYALEMSASFLPAVFFEIFGNPVRNTHEYPTESLGNLGDVTTGGTPPSVKSGMFGGKIPFITPGDLEVDTQCSQRFLTDAGVKESVSVRAGSTLVCCIGATIGKTDKARVRCSFNQQINAVEWGKNINDDFGFYLMRFFSQVIADRGRSTTLPILKKSAFEELILPVSPMPLQQKFSVIVKRHERLHSSQCESLRQAEHLFQSLLHQAFGEN